jgi:hypothetical protein
MQYSKKTLKRTYKVEKEEETKTYNNHNLNKIKINN